ncbi:helix-turn-helix transcriptional regulator [Pseudomonas plecoglossicida]
MTRPALAAVIRTVRSSLGLTQEGLGHAISRTYAAKIENAASSPTLDKFIELAAALNMNPVALLSLVIATRDNVATSTVLAEAADQLAALEAKVSASDITAQLTGKEISKRPAARPADLLKLQQVLESKNAGLTKAETARKLGLSRSTVGFLWNRSPTKEDGEA